MQRMRSRTLATWTFLELAIVGLGLWFSISTYTYYVTALCGGLGSLGQVEGLLTLLALALPLAVIVPIAIVITAARQRQWAWVAVVVHSLAVGVTLILTSATNEPAHHLIIALLGNACGNYDAFIVDFLAYALVALKPSDSSPAWQTALTGAYGSFLLVVAPNRVYVASEATKLQGGGPHEIFSAYAAADGSLLWSHEEQQLTTRLIATSTGVYVGTNDASANENGIITLDPATGARRWQTTLGVSEVLIAANHALAFVAITPHQAADDTIIPGSLLALDVRDGSHAWQTHSPIPANPGFLAASESVVYGIADPNSNGNVAGNNSIFALDAATGAPLWNVELDTITNAIGLALGTETIFVLENTIPGNLLVARRVSDGAARWTFQVDGYVELEEVVG